MLFGDTATYEESRRGFPSAQRAPGAECRGLAKPWVLRVRRRASPSSTGLHCVSPLRTHFELLCSVRAVRIGLVSPSSGLTCACL